MSKSCTPAQQQATPDCPFLLVDLLDTLGGWRRDIDEAGRKDAVATIQWFTQTISKWAGIPEWKTRTLIDRLVVEGGLDGDSATMDEVYANRRKMGLYGGYLDVNDVAARLHVLDKDGTTRALWRLAYAKWPLIRRIYQTYHDVCLAPSGAGKVRAGAHGATSVVHGPSLAKALAVEAIQNDRMLPGGKKLTVAELRRQLAGAGIHVTRSAMYENKEYEGVRRLLQPLGLFEKLPVSRAQRDVVRRGSKDKVTRRVEVADHREDLPDRCAR
jgi:hypothetical protein